MLLDDEPQPPQLPPAPRPWTVLAFCLLAVGIGTQLYFVIRPRTVRQDTANQVVLRVDPASLPMEIAAIFVAAAAGLFLVVAGQGSARHWGGVLLTVVLVCAIVTWQHHSLFVAVGAGSFTAPQRGRLLQGESTTVHFEGLKILRFVGTGGNDPSRYIQCQSKANQSFEFKLGPLTREAEPLIERAAREAGVKVEYWN